MTPRDLENEADTPKQYFIDIILKHLIYEIGNPMPNSFPKIWPQAQISTKLTPDDLENEVATLKIW